MTDATDELDDAEFARLIRLCALGMRTKVAQSLLAGNDTGCFTTEQYREAYQRRHPLSDIKPDDVWAYITPEEHLRSISRTVREVAPGVWAAVEAA